VSEVIVGKVSSDKEVAQFLVGDKTFIGYYHPDNKQILFEYQENRQFLDKERMRLDKKDYAELMKKASAILAKRTPR